MPIPEVFGHAEENGQRLICMSLMEGDSLQERLAKLTETGRRTVCAELRHDGHLAESPEARPVGSVHW